MDLFDPFKKGDGPGREKENGLFSMGRLFAAVSFSARQRAEAEELRKAEAPKRIGSS